MEVETPSPCAIKEEIRKKMRISNNFFRLLLDENQEPCIFLSPLRWYMMQIIKAPVAQLDRASDYGSEGLGFESLRACHLHHEDTESCLTDKEVRTKGRFFCLNIHNVGAPWFRLEV